MKIIENFDFDPNDDQSMGEYLVVDKETENKLEYDGTQIECMNYIIGCLIEK